MVFLDTNDINNSDAKHHLSKSYIAGDREYHARFVAAAHAFATQDYKKCFDLVDDVVNRSPREFSPALGRMERWLEPALKSRSGIVMANFGSHLFVKLRDCLRDVYAPSGETPDKVWDTIQVHTR